MEPRRDTSGSSDSRRLSDSSQSPPSSTTSRSLSLEPVSKIIDIRRTKEGLTNLRADTIKGLSQPYGQKYLPSLLLWDEKGQQLYNGILESEAYYPYRVEKELLEQKVPDIARMIASTGSEILVELGAGNMEKTALLLRHLDGYNVRMTYYALDVDRLALDESLKGLQDGLELRNISLRALQGTYEDGAHWLGCAEEAREKRKCIAWVGNSIANFQQHEAGELLGHFTEANGVRNLSGFFVGIDGCQDLSLIDRAYDVPGGATRRWVNHALEASRDHIGDKAGELFNQKNWRWAAGWNPDTHRYENYLAATKPLHMTVDDVSIEIAEDETIHTVGSGKWTRADVEQIVSRRNFKVVQTWNSQEIDYGIYWLQQPK